MKTLVQSITKPLVLSVSATFLLAVPASAQLIVLGEGHAAGCYQSALTGNPGTRSALQTCNDALERTTLTRRDRAATLVNRGVLLMRAGENERAEADYVAALEIKPDLPEAHINHGVALYHQEKFADALAAYDRALAGEETDKDALALFNRGLVHERLENTTRAYRDFKRASELMPDWDQPRDALTRFTVTKRSS
jgi:Tfp pilus assembly protein PilF